MSNREENQVFENLSPERLRGFASMPDGKERLQNWLPSLRARLKIVLDFHGWKRRSLGRRARLAKNQVSLIMGSGKGLKWETLLSIVYATGVNGHWLLTGEGDNWLTEAVRLEKAAIPEPEDAEAARRRAKAKKIMATATRKNDRTDRPVAKTLTKEANRSHKRNKTSPT